MRNILLTFVIALFWGTSTEAQDSNYPDRKALIVNNCPFVELSGFSFKNEYADRATRFNQDLTWKNTGTQPILAIEVVILKYDAFDRRLVGTRWTVTGRNSADWSPLQPGASNSDGTRGLGTEEVFTAIAYVRSARLADGSVWRASDADLLAKLRSQVPGFKDFGDLKPDSKPSPNT